MFEPQPRLILIRGGLLAFCLALAACGNAVGTTGAANSTVSGTGSTPAAPASITATPGNSQVSLVWSASQAATSYDVMRSTVSGGPYTQVATATSPSYTDDTVKNGTTYHYVVAAVNEDGQSGDSPEASVTPDPTITTPAVPAGLAATSGNAQVSLAWSATSSATSYHVKRSTTSGGPYAQIGAPTSTSYTDTSLVNGTKYYYVVSAVNSAGESANSTQVSGVPTAPTVAVPAAPAGLAANPGNALVSLTWSATSGATSYHVKRATTSGGPYTQIGAPTSATYSDSGLTNGTEYYYVVSALNSGGESANSGEANATPVAPAPVGTCDNLPAAGSWENITPTAGLSGDAIIVDPFNSNRVWLGTSGSGIWRTDDCGSTWTKVSPVPGGSQWSMQVDPVTPGVIYATSGYGAESLWKTVDGGSSWTDVLAGSVYDSVAQYRFVNNVSLDPTNHQHLVVSTHGTCAAPYAPNCIAESTDGGSTWRVMTAPEAWTEGGGLIIVKGGVWIWCGTNMLVTTNNGASWSSNVLAGGGTCEAEYTIRNFVPASNGKYYLGSRNGVLESSDGQAWQNVSGTSGLMVMIAQGSTKVFAANQWQPSLQWASLSNDKVWASLPAPPQISQGHDGGIPFLAYDDTHGILYASLFSGGVARMVVPK